MVNNLTGFAVATGEVFLKSDGSSWRPLVHIEDISRAFCAIAEADRGVVHNEAFNIGATQENYRISDVANIVEETVPECAVKLSDEAFNDIRNYKVSFEKYESTFPDMTAVWTVRKGVEELREAMVANNLTVDTLEGPHLMRVQTLRQLQDAGKVANDIRWSNDPAESVAALSTKAAR